MGELQQYPQSIACFSFSQNLSNKDKRKQCGRAKKQRNEQPWTPAYTLFLQTMTNKEKNEQP
jgi:hypothetical protein